MTAMFMKAESRPVSWYEVSVDKLKGLHGLSNYHIEDEECSIAPYFVDSTMKMANTGYDEAIVAACHLLLLSNSSQGTTSVWEPYANLAQEIYVPQSSRDQHHHHPRKLDNCTSDSLTPRSLSSCNSRTNLSNDSILSNNAGTRCSCLITECEVFSGSITPADPWKRKAFTDSPCGEIGGRARENEILERPARKRRYRSLSELMRSSR